jgi:putative proteasome-type protease
MTYCMGLLLQEGLVMVADSRTNAGVDQVANFRKMHVWESPGERVLVLMTAGNLAISQGVVSSLHEGLRSADDPKPSMPKPSMMTVPTMGDAARLVGAAVRSVEQVDGPSLRAHHVDFDFSAIVGGQIRGGPPRLFLVYSAGNFIESAPETPFFQIGENKYGKPILDRVIQYGTNLADAAKCALISMDSTLRSNVSVGAPVDMLVYRRDALRVATRQSLAENDPYFAEVRAAWSSGLRSVFSSIKDPPWAIGAP